MSARVDGAANMERLDALVAATCWGRAVHPFGQGVDERGFKIRLAAWCCPSGAPRPLSGNGGPRRCETPAWSGTVAVYSRRSTFDSLGVLARCRTHRLVD